MGSTDDSDGTVRVSSDDRQEARRRLDKAIGSDATISDGGVGAAGPAGAETDLPAGHSVGEYQIEDVIGRGGFGTVYRAVQPLIGKRVAIKVLSRKFSADTEMVSRFVAEARAVNQIRHRHIIDIFSFGQLPDGRQYYVMEHLDGEPLDRHLANNGPLQLQDALPIMRAVARALDAAHAKGVAHRDLKPENIFLTRDDEGLLFPKLLDFGIAKLSNTEEALAHKTNTGVPIGTPYYMSPEQCRGKDVDNRTDIYSFGVLAYRLLTGAYPFDGALVDILHKHMYDDPPAPSRKNPALEPHVDAAILWMMRKDPNERPKNASSAVVALQGDEAGVPALPSSTRAVRNRRWIAPLVALIVIAAGAAVFVVMNREPLEPATPTPEAVAMQAAPPDRGDAATVAPPPSEPAGSATVAPRHVIVDVQGVPDGTEVLVGGKIVGTAPGDVQLAHGDAKVVLTFRADGYISQSKTILPTEDQELKLQLKKKPRTSRQTPSGEDGKDDVIHVFGKEKGK